MSIPFNMCNAENYAMTLFLKTQKCRGTHRWHKNVSHSSETLSTGGNTACIARNFLHDNLWRFLKACCTHPPSYRKDSYHMFHLSNYNYLYDKLALFSSFSAAFWSCNSIPIAAAILYSCYICQQNYYCCWMTLTMRPPIVTRLPSLNHTKMLKQ